MRIVLATRDVWVAEVDDRVVAMMALDGDLLDHLYVLPAFQGHGIGDRLLAQAKHLSPRRLRLYTFQSNLRAREFYEAHGFVPIEFSDGSRNEEGAPDVLYEWTGISRKVESAESGNGKLIGDTWLTDTRSG